MIAYLYICSSSFSYNGIDSISIVCEKLKQFTLLFDYIWEHFREDNIFCINKTQLPEVIVYNKTTLTDILFTDKSPLDKQYRFLFQTALQKSLLTKIDKNKDLNEYLSLESPEECQGIVVINKQDDIPVCNQVFSTISGWREFRRFFLSKYPKSPEFFISEAEKYFPKLQFSENIYSKLNEVLSTHSRKIVDGLSILNDYCFNDWTSYSGNAITFIEQFAKKHGSEGSSEGTKKAALKAKFKKKQQKEEFEYYCGPHLKYNEDDYGNTRQYMRIYFQHPNASPDEYIYIGYIMKHVN